MTEYTIGDAADFLGVTAKALRHWDSIGLLSAQARRGGEPIACGRGFDNNNPSGGIHHGTDE